MKEGTKKAWEYFTHFNNLSDIGTSFSGRIKGFMPNIGSYWVSIASLTIIIKSWNDNLNVNLFGWHIHFFPIPVFSPFILIIFYFIKQYLGTGKDFFIGLIMKKKGAIKVQAEIMANDADYNPWQKALRKTIENIAEKLGAHNEFPTHLS